MMVGESPSSDEMRFFKEAVFNYSLFEPALPEPEGVSKVFFTTDSRKTATAGAGDASPAGAIASTSASLRLPVWKSWRAASKGHALEAVAKAMGYSLRLHRFWRWMNDAEMLSMAGKAASWAMPSA
jgi:hydroxymethylpyrimidine pyrophosphatase-like HAD family hydrolase